jgi:hypothetical protein
VENTKLFAVHVQGIMPVFESVIISGTTAFEAVEKAHVMFKVTRDKVLVKKGNGLYRVQNGKLVRVCMHKESVKMIIAKF